MTPAHSDRRPPPSSELARRPLMLRIHPDPALRVWCSPVRTVNRRIEVLARAMLALMRVHRGIGLAAPQVGLDVRLIVADPGTGPVCLVNPELTTAADRASAAEGCLSLPGASVQVERALAVEVRGLDPAGKRLHFEARGLLARVLQHEVDHLDGILIIDRGPMVTSGDSDPVCARSAQPFL